MEIQLDRGEGAGTYLVTALGEGLYRLEMTEVPFFFDPDSPLRLGDVVELAEDADGVFRVVRLVEPSPYRMESYCLRRENVARVLEEADRRGILFENYFGGWVYLHFRSDQSWDLRAWLGNHLFES